jgi:hypothetical protein
LRFTASDQKKKFREMAVAIRSLRANGVMERSYRRDSLHTVNSHAYKFWLINKGEKK